MCPPILVPTLTKSHQLYYLPNLIPPTLAVPSSKPANFYTRQFLPPTNFNNRQFLVSTNFQILGPTFKTPLTLIPLHLNTHQPINIWGKVQNTV